MKRFFTVLLGMALVGLVGWHPSFAEHLSKGDVLACFESAGLTAIRLISQASEEAGPSEGCREGVVAPFIDTDVRRYCVDDWHVIRLSLILGDLPYREAAASLEATGVQFFLDGVAISTTRNPVKRASGGWWLFAEGKIYAPGEISLGSHTIRLRSTHPEFVTPTNPEGVWIDRTREFSMEEHDASFCSS